MPEDGFVLVAGSAGAVQGDDEGSGPFAPCLLHGIPDFVLVISIFRFTVREDDGLHLVGPVPAVALLDFPGSLYFMV